MGLIRNVTRLLPQSVRFGLRRVFFFGGTYRCVLCHSWVREFRAHGGGAAVLNARQVVGGMRREGDRCPACHGVDRTRMIMLHLSGEADVGKRSLRVLHVAPEFGLYLWLKRQPQVDYVATDLDAVRYRHIEDFCAADLMAMPFADESFDVIVCSHVLEHIPNDGSAIAELFRILRPGGQALLLAPFALDNNGTEEDGACSDPAERHLRFGQWDHVRIYDREDFLSRMRAVGFEVALFDPYGVDPANAAELCLNPLEKLPIGRKPAG
jgi:SAM-dependent methyltransferase